MKIATSITLFFVLLGYATPALSQTIKITKAQVSFEFVSKKVEGTLSGFTSNSAIDWDNLEKSTFEGSVLSETLDTNNGLRNWSLRGRKYFNVDDFPLISFKSSTVSLIGDELAVEGNLKIKETSKLVTFTFKKDGNQLIGTTSLYSIDYGIKIKKKREDNLVRVKIVFDLE